MTFYLKPARDAATAGVTGGATAGQPEAGR